MFHLKRESLSNWANIPKSSSAQNPTGPCDKILLSKNEKLLGFANLSLFNKPSSTTWKALEDILLGLHDLLSLTPLPLSVTLLGHHGNQVAIEISCLAGEWSHVTNFFLCNFSSYMWFLHVLEESRRQRRYLSSKLKLLLIYFICFIPF